MGALLPPRFMARVRINPPTGGGGKTLGVRELCDRDPTHFERIVFYMYKPFNRRFELQ